MEARVEAIARGLARLNFREMDDWYLQKVLSTTADCPDRRLARMAYWRAIDIATKEVEAPGSGNR